ncbi:hypothetical protein POM88_008713 [Heracleum sosnowskyi]|uniref:Uncharacterized protein n=1 Tax=Heracleum sosnowskyi TaxID=360622 RepID=A0AAD8N1Z0_9APIA|nr:hypothetical protein POM88_008713 [Heracleum sosnowskyi]
MVLNFMTVRVIHLIKVVLRVISVCPSQHILSDGLVFLESNFLVIADIFSDNERDTKHSNLVIIVVEINVGGIASVFHLHVMDNGGVVTVIGVLLVSLTPDAVFTLAHDVEYSIRPLGHADLFYLDDKDVDLKDVIEAPLFKAPLDTSIVYHWLTIESVQPAIPENALVKAITASPETNKAKHIENELPVDIKKHVPSRELQFNKIIELTLSRSDVVLLKEALTLSMKFRICFLESTRLGSSSAWTSGRVTFSRRMQSVDGAFDAGTDFSLEVSCSGTLRDLD